jgi:hypothetical protein
LGTGFICKALLCSESRNHDVDITFAKQSLASIYVPKQELGDEMRNMQDGRQCEIIRKKNEPVLSSEFAAGDFYYRYSVNLLVSIFCHIAVGRESAAHPAFSNWLRPNVVHLRARAS